MDTSALVAGFASPESVDTCSEMAGFAPPESVDTAGGEMAGFACDSRRRPRPAHHDPDGLQIAADGFAPDAGRLLDAPQRPPESPQRHNLVVFVVSQDVAHAA